MLESLANGVPVAQPRHGAFPELIEATGGGLLVEPDDPEDLAKALEHLLTDHDRRYEFGRTGQGRVRERFSPRALVDATLSIFSGEITQGSTQGAVGTLGAGVPTQA